MVFILGRYRVTFLATSRPISLLLRMCTGAGVFLAKVTASCSLAGVTFLYEHPRWIRPVKVVHQKKLPPTLTSVY